jgi:hypothetical protein
MKAGLLSRLSVSQLRKAPHIIPASAIDDNGNSETLLIGE